MYLRIATELHLKRLVVGGFERVFELSRVQALTYQQIATTLDISVKTVATLMGRALRALRASLRPRLDE